MLDRLESKIGQFKSASVLVDKLSKKRPVKQVKKPTPVHFATKKQQTHIAMGFYGLSMYDRDRYALEVLNNVLSGQSGRLFLELRDKMSLAYTVTSTLIEGQDCGLFGTYIGTDPSKKNQAIDAMWEQLKRIKTEKISEVELARAKQYIIGNHQIDHQKHSAVASFLALTRLYNKPLEEFYTYTDLINKITTDDILRVAQRVINEKAYVLSLVGP
jgi:zinc protease